ncbi:NADP-dependent 3-hydroxy acid dehydrogenase YdfG [Actinocorallia herbida]|uniref:NADP-dependent 3-hydroxy acid dehydrogenase YdfG n=1 Tax=Actinocorallia herbida TaxID=58109 RepID=A0A3N1D7C6_9ACTN|nr:SDR family oxidoreductase [Actinocorallia herbida]ROO89433.1 NADP-dependent 3-hydroxy acid dehydrogenase YdfG [Actinocorallia herbida]
MTTTIVTGGASGIGAAIAAELIARGDTVVLADLNGTGAAEVAERLTAAGPGKAFGAALDVTDAAAVRELYEGVARDHAGLDLVFNNAGIAIAGLAEELTLDHWNRAIDINLKGVVHGVDAAYRIMRGQGRGHIVNTASLAGLVPMPMGIPYTATKHAVVGLTLALRAEAAVLGIRVGALCPGFIATNLLRTVNAGLPETGMSSKADAEVPKIYPADKLAKVVMKGVRRNKAVIVAPAYGRLAWLGARLSPAGAVRASRLAADGYRKEHGI